MRTERIGEELAAIEAVAEELVRLGDVDALLLLVARLDFLAVKVSQAAERLASSTPAD